jgi:hypothetical protein
MLLKPLTLAAGLLALPATQAFLVPPEVSDADIQVANTIENIGSQVAETRAIDVDCPGCPVLVTGRRGRPVQLQIDRPSHLEFTFSIDHQPNHDRLLVNGFELYPSSGMMRDELSAPQVVDREDKEKRHRKHPHKLEPQPQRLGFGVMVGPAKKDVDGQFELVEIELQIIEVGVTFIDGISSLKVNLIKDTEGRLIMSQVLKGEPKNLLGGHKGGADECTSRMCKWLAAAKEKLKKFKGFGNCHGAAKGGMRPAADPHHPHHPDGHWRAPYQQRRWSKLFMYIGSHIILPVLIGVAAGVTASLIGMAVGTVIVSLWRVLFRRRRSSRSHRRRHSHARKAALKEAALVEEKSGLIEHQDPPPAYEDEEAVKTSQV